MKTYDLSLALACFLTFWMATALDYQGFHSKAKAVSQLECFPHYEAYVIEFLWILNTDSTRGYYDFSKQMRDKFMPSLLQNISQAFPGSRAGIATYASTRNDPCYTLVQPLTRDMSTVAQKLKSVTISYGGDSPEFSLLGMALAASDPNVGWSTGQLTPGNGSVRPTQKRIIKVLCLSADDVSNVSYDKEASDSHVLKPLAGTSSRTCLNTSPSPQQFGRILNKHDVSFVGLITHDFLERWKDYFKEMRVTGNIRPLSLDQFELIIPDVMDALHDVICLPTPTPTEAPKTSTSSDEYTTAKGRNTVAIISGASAGAVALAGAAAYLAYRYFFRSRSQGDEGSPAHMIDVEDSAGANNREQAIVSGAEAEHYR